MDNFSTPEPVMHVPPAPGTVQAQPTQQHPKRGWMLWAGIGLAIVVVLGGGYFAYSKGYVIIPFLTPNSDALFGKVSDSITQITSAQYGVHVDVQAQPRQSGIQPLFNANDNVNLVPDSLGNSSLAFLTELDPTEALKSIPTDVKLGGGVTTFVETDKPAKEANGQVGFDGEYTGSDTSLSFNVELRKVGQNFYGLVSKFPSIPGFDLSGIKNKWIIITPDDSIADYSTDAIDNQDTKGIVNAVQAVTKRVLKDGLVTVDKKLGSETINGVSTQHYLLAIHPEKLVGIYQEIRDEHAKAGKPTADLDATITSLKKADSQKFLSSLAKNSKVEAWVDKTHGYLRQFRWGVTVVPDASIERWKDKQLNLAVTLSLNKINEKVHIDVPSPTTSFDEATRLVTGVTVDKQNFDKQTSRVDEVRYALTDYKTAHQSYPSSLDQLSSTLKQDYATCQAKIDAKKTSKSDDPDAISRDAQRRSDIGSLRSGLTLYFDDNNGQYPDKLSALSPTYLATIPTDPSTKAQYTYSSCGTGFVLSTTLETSTQVYVMTSTGTADNEDAVPACQATVAPTNTGNTNSFQVEQIGGTLGLGSSCQSQYKNGVKTTDVYTNKPYGYTTKDGDYALTYQIKFGEGVDSFEKDSYIEGTNTANSADVSIEKQPTKFIPGTVVNASVNTNAKIDTNSSTNTNNSVVSGSPVTGSVIIPTDKTKDTDGDGLTDFDEVTIYRTDMNKKDSDGDGFNDKDEVSGKYNPLGSGKATAQELLEWGLQPIVQTGAVTPTVSTAATSTGTLFTITSQTNVDAVLNYGPTTAYGGLLTDQPFTNMHHFSVAIPSGTTYHYSIRVCTQQSACYSTADRTVTGE